MCGEDTKHWKTALLCLWNCCLFCLIRSFLYCKCLAQGYRIVVWEIGSLSTQVSRWVAFIPLRGHYHTAALLLLSAILWTLFATLALFFRPVSSVMKQGHSWNSFTWLNWKDAQKRVVLFCTSVNYCYHYGLWCDMSTIAINCRACRTTKKTVRPFFLSITTPPQKWLIICIHYV